MVITDGRSQDDVLPPARTLKAAGEILFEPKCRSGQAIQNRLLSSTS